MELILLVLVLLVGVGVGEYAARLAPVSIPPPLVQILLGAALSLMGLRVALQPQAFFLLFLPPLLFLDGWRIPKDALLHGRRAYLELSLGLVFFTVVVLGLLVHALIPAMPLTVSFALAAALSPTDPIAVSAIAKRTPMPRRLTNLLEGEALFNDASGLVAMKFAVAAALTGTFSLWAATTSFVWLAVGGLAIGVATAFGVVRLHGLVVRRAGDDPTTQILVSLLIPFGAYLLAEHWGCSGILAAVSAGVTLSLVERPDQISADSRMRRNAVWSTIQATANGAIFLILGAQLPAIGAAAAASPGSAASLQPWRLLACIAAITLALAGLRFGWVWVSVSLQTRRRRRQGQAWPAPPLRVLAAMSLAGVKGAVTLAAILALPLALKDGSPFPARDLAVFLASGVILATLLVATIGLPLTLKSGQLAAEREEEDEESAVRAQAAASAIAAIEALIAERRTRLSAAQAEAAAEVLGRMRDQLEGLRTHGPRPPAERAFQQEMMSIALKAQRKAIKAHTRASQTELRDRLIGELDLFETAIAAR